jgi:2-oxoglutarate decarboxylase
MTWTLITESGRSAVPSQETPEGESSEFGANEWLVDEMYERFKVDRDAVDKSWWPILENYHQTKVTTDAPAGDQPQAQPAAPEAGSAAPQEAESAAPQEAESAAPQDSDAAAPEEPRSTAPAEAEPSPQKTAEATEAEPISESDEPAKEAADDAPPQEPQVPRSVTGENDGSAAEAAPAPATQETSPSTQPVAKTTSVQAKPQPIPAEAPPSAPQASEEPTEPQDKVTTLRGAAKSIASNMDMSLTVPTATSVRTMPAKLMVDNRIVINNHMKRARGGKISFTHLIAWAMIQTLKEFPSQNVYYDEVDGKPSVVSPANINLGIAIDLPKPDGTRSLVVPGIKRTETMGFGEFLSAYEDVVKRARENKLTMADYQGNTISLTNPGGIGTEHSVPRLMKGAGCIIGAGALEYPAEFQGTSPRTLANMGIGKTVTLTSTYDHRVIQGAGSGEFLKIIHERLIGGHNFYEEIFAAHPLRADPVGGRHPCRPRFGRRQDRARAGTDQLVPGARAPDGRHRSARVRPALTPRPRHCQPRPELLGPRPRVHHRRFRRQAHRAAARHPGHAP